MKKLLPIIMAVVLAVPIFAQAAKTINGEVVDLSCYITAGARGEGHKACAIDCLKAGEPAGILDDKTGKIYVVVTEDHKTNPREKVMPYVAKMVEATGTVSEHGGMSTIDISSIKELPSSEALNLAESAAAAKGKSTSASKTMKGEVIDTSCYIAAGARGEGHKACAIDCLKAGEPTGILEDKTGKIYLIVTSDHKTNPADKIMAYVAKMVEVTGTASERGGFNTIEIKDIKETKTASIAPAPEKKKETRSMY